MSMKISDIEFYGSVFKKGGTSSQFLKADGSIDSSAYITLSSISVTAPLTYNSSTGALNINQASSTTSGWLSYTDWATFNGKQAAGNYVTTDTTQTISGAKTFSTQLWIGANAVIGGTNGQIQFDAAASSDLFISCIPSTRTVQIRNGNSGSPNYAACGLETGYINLHNNLTIDLASGLSGSNNITLNRASDGNLINATTDNASNVMSLIVGGYGSMGGSYGYLTLGRNGYDKIGLNAAGNSWITTAPDFSSNGNYALASTNNITIGTSSTFNSGGIWCATNSTNLVNWNGNNTLGSGVTMAGHIMVNRHIFKASGITITCTQSSGIRATAALQVLQQTGGNYAGTVSHGAGIFVQGVYPTTGYTSTFTNYYGILINSLDEWGGVTLTNRWGIYQAGSSDNNYFAGKVNIGGTGSTPLHVVGEITSYNGEMYYKRSTFSHYGHVYMGSDSHFYIKNTGAYNLYLQTNGVNQVILQNDGVTKISNLRTTTIYSEFVNNLTGGYSAGNWYTICSKDDLTIGGIYMLVAYVDTYAVGGGTYFCTYASVPFYWFAGGSNSGSTQTFPAMLGTGHANLNPPIIRIRLESNNSGGRQYLEFDPNATWSNLTGGGGATVTFYVKRLGA